MLGMGAGRRTVIPGISRNFLPCRVSEMENRSVQGAGRGRGRPERWRMGRRLARETEKVVGQTSRMPSRIFIEGGGEGGRRGKPRLYLSAVRDVNPNLDVRQRGACGDFQSSVVIIYSYILSPYFHVGHKVEQRGRGNKYNGTQPGHKTTGLRGGGSKSREYCGTTPPPGPGEGTP